MRLLSIVVRTPAHHCRGTMCSGCLLCSCTVMFEPLTCQQGVSYCAVNRPACPVACCNNPYACTYSFPLHRCHLRSAASSVSLMRPASRCRLQAQSMCLAVMLLASWTALIAGTHEQGLQCHSGRCAVQMLVCALRRCWSADVRFGPSACDLAPIALCLWKALCLLIDSVQGIEFHLVGLLARVQITCAGI